MSSFNSGQQSTRAHRTILWLFLLTFLLPALLTPPWLILEKALFKQRKNPVVTQANGKDPLSALQQFSLQSWLNGTFQDRFSRSFGEAFALRKLFIRFTNQLYYTFFSKSYMDNQGIIVGKGKCLYELIYIQDYCRLSVLLPPDQTETLAKEIAAVQNLFKGRGVAFLVMITPDKATVYPEYIPDVFMKRKTEANRDYEHMTQLFRKYGINYIDGPAITLNAKKKTDLPLFCRGSSHWNYWGAFFTAQQLIEKIESLKKSVLTHLSCSEVKVDNRPKGSDRDLASLLNTVFPPYDYPTPHPVIKPVPHAHDFKGDIVFIGGSFNKNILDILSQNRIFKTIDSYYYYKNNLVTFPQNPARESAFKVEAVNWGRDFFGKDIVILEINEAAFQSGHVRAFLADALEHLSGIKHKKATK